jgi:hypothetical protein
MYRPFTASFLKTTPYRNLALALLATIYPTIAVIHMTTSICLFLFKIYLSMIKLLLCLNTYHFFNLSILILRSVSMFLSWETLRSLMF